LSESETPPPPAPRKGSPWHHLAGHLTLDVLVLIIGLVVIAAAVVRFGPDTPAGRAFIAAQLEGLPIGPVGKLHVEGLSGDLWSNFGVARLTITDRDGVWLDARKIVVSWRPIALWGRRAYITDLEGQVRLMRQPVVQATGPPGRLPVSISIDRARIDLETLPAASSARGLYATTGTLELKRNGAAAGALDAESRLHPGDGLKARFDFGVHQRLAVTANAREAQGGALAGLLGLPANKPFTLDAVAGGAKDGNGWLRLRATSGAEQIASADGMWTKAGGGQASGQVSLAASRWTAPMLKALGPMVRFTAAGRPADGPLYGVALFARSDNATAQAVGLADPAKLTTPNGLAIQASVSDLRRIVATPAMGRGTLNGQFKGGWGDWRISGNAAVEQLGLGGYALARVSGPIELARAKRQWTLKADATGDGGRGSGLLAAMIGGRPHATLEATRLADGRTLIQSLKAQGSGLALDATGQMGLLGGLNFKGNLKVSNLAMAHAGARGTIQATWTAGQAHWGQPWSVDLNAQGADFASGLGQLDRLFGDKPKLAASGAWDAGTITIAKADLAGVAADLKAAGPIGKDGALKLALNWTAHGPFDAGPVEIAGAASGNGAITGTWGAPRIDLLAELERVDVPELALKPAHLVLSFISGPDGFNGDIALTGSSDYGPARAKAAFRFIQGGVALSGIDAAGGGATATGDLTLSGDAPSVADLTISAGQGAFLAQGHADAQLKIADTGGSPMVNLHLKATNAEPRGAPLVATAVDLSADGPLSHAAYKVSGDMAWAGTPVRLQGSGVASETSGAYAVSFDGAGKIRKTAFRTLSPAEFTFGDADETAKASLAIGAGRVDLDARQSGPAFTAKAKLDGVDLGAIDDDFTGRVDADLAIDGQGQALSGALTAHLAQARVRDAPVKLAMDGDIKASLANSRLAIAADATDPSGGRASVNLDLPAEATASPFRIAVSQTQPMSGRFDLDGEIEPVWQLLFGGERTLAGRASAHGTIAGSVNSPSFTGQASLAQGRFEDAATGLKLRNVTAQADLAQDSIAVRTFTAADAKSGTVSGEGQVNLAKGGESTLTLNLKSFQLLDNETATAIASGAVTISRNAAGKATLAGTLLINRADISTKVSRAPPGVVAMDVVERNRPASLDTGLQAQSTDHGLSAALNINLRSSGGVFVKGLGLNAEMSLDATVTGDTNRPELQGTANVVRGDYQLAGQRFEIETQSTVYLASDPQAIRLDITASRDDPTLTAIVKIGGTAAKPEITLSSTPVLPQDEILAQVLFGTSASQLSGVEAAQLAAALASLATGGGFDVLGGLQNFARLDRLALGTDNASGTTVSGGKYIGKRFYLELTGGGRYGPSAQVEYRANHGLALVSQVGGEAGAKLAVRWRHDYGHSTDAQAKKKK
jgi:translocation and assembly module TamB